MKDLRKIKNVYIEEIEVKQDFTEFAHQFSSIPGTVLLMSGGDLDCSRYHILATMPWLEFSSYEGTIKITNDGQSSEIHKNSLDYLDDLITYFKFENMRKDLPVTAGLFGYISYDIKDQIEILPNTACDKWKLPQIYLIAPSLIIVHDKVTSKTSLCIPIRENIEEASQVRNIKEFITKQSKIERAESNYSSNYDQFKSDFDKEEYIEAIKNIIEYISAGDVYQVNMSQRFESSFSGSSFALFKALYQKNPAPFFAYINGRDHQIVSTSPERFILQKGRYVESRPIKGTRPRATSPAEDELQKKDLTESKKDEAELSMIVDLMRNDIGKVCKANSVKVQEHKRVETYQNVFHMISIIKGELENDCNSIDLIRATFPGGSITGCPKIRSMEIIDEFEKHRRHIYTGSIGYISFHDTVDLSIAIRTATIYDNKIAFSVGGGIVYDSNPLDEYYETLHKGRTLFEAFTGDTVV